MFDSSVPKRLKPSQVKTIFNQKLYETLLWKMQQCERFSNDEREIKGTDIDLWDIVIGNRFAGIKGGEDRENEFGIVIGARRSDRSTCDKVDIMIMEELFTTRRYKSAAGYSPVYFTENNTFRTIRADELPEFWKALEACYA